MSGTFEGQIDLAFDLRRQRRRQNQAEQEHAKKAIEDSHAALELKQAAFHGRVRPLLEAAVADTNRHLAGRSERCKLHEVSGYFTGPWYPGGFACNPIAYELRVDGQELGETLLVELNHDGMLEASLGPFHPHVSEGQSTRLDIGWPAVRLEDFDMEAARHLVIRFLSAILARCPI
jgi:hypothetical protein